MARRTAPKLIERRRVGFGGIPPDTHRLRWGTSQKSGSPFHGGIGDPDLIFPLKSFGTYCPRAFLISSMLGIKSLAGIVTILLAIRKGYCGTFLVTPMHIGNIAW